MDYVLSKSPVKKCDTPEASTGCISTKACASWFARVDDPESGLEFTMDHISSFT